MHCTGLAFKPKHMQAPSSSDKVCVLGACRKDFMHIGFRLDHSGQKPSGHWKPAYLIHGGTHDAAKTQATTTAGTDAHAARRGVATQDANKSSESLRVSSPAGRRYQSTAHPRPTLRAAPARPAYRRGSTATFRACTSRGGLNARRLMS
mmetsp:Transcript_10028/g.31447  ORF Transcript_10028/g.31447 Transcript_10028/m.31447 type:complete len:149 (+) Transcript_10028:123-569(+)